MRVAILVPRRADDGWRDKLWNFCRPQWIEAFPDWQIFEGHHHADEGPFNRSMAINRASASADAWYGYWDVALIIDADTVSDPAAVRRAVEHAHRTGELSIAHHARAMMTERATQQILGGLPMESWNRRVHVKKTYYDSVSCAVAVSRPTWDLVGGFDERFVGWGFEDTGFHIAVETLTGRDRHVEQSTCYHLWHPPSPEASHLAPTFGRNHALKRRYEVAHWDPDRVRAVIAGKPDPGAAHGQIPKILWRTVPEMTRSDVEEWWTEFEIMNPTWEAHTIREPVDPRDFPMTGHLFPQCANGAQRAGLIRLELLYTHGGIYVDSDVQPVRPLDALTWLPAFAAWEDDKVVPDAVLGSTPEHPAIRECLRRAIALVEGGSVDAWETGPGVTTAVLPGRDDVLLLPPGSFYPVHYREKNQLGSRNGQPWVFMEHKWHHSWDPKKKASATAPRVRIESTKKIELPDFKIGICIPWRDANDQWRRDALEWCVNWWLGHDLAVYQGAGDNRSQMCNDAARLALEDGVDVLVFADADTWAPVEQVITAAVRAHLEGGLVHAFNDYRKLDQHTTRQGQRGVMRPGRPERMARLGKIMREHVSGLSAISVETWKQVGGFDEQFVGWGFEDQAFHLACETIASVSRIEGKAIHWYHKADPTKAAEPDPTLVSLMEDYCRAAGRIPGHGRVARLAAQGLISIDSAEPNASRMQALLSRPGGPLSPADAVS